MINKILKRFSAITIGWLILVFLLSIIPFSGFDKIDGPKIILGVRDDYWEHLLFFIASGIMIYLAWIDKYKLLRLIIFAITYAIICEAIQYLLPYRTFNPIDLILNIFGILAGIAIAPFLRNFFQKKLRTNKTHS